MEERKEDISTKTKLRILAGDVYASSDLFLWCYSKDRTLLFTTCPLKNKMQDLLRIGGCLDYLYGKTDGWKEPVLLNDQLGLMWIGESFMEESGTDRRSASRFCWGRPLFPVLRRRNSGRRSQTGRYLCRQPVRWAG